MNNDPTDNRTEIRVALSQRGVAIPYGPVERDDRGENFGYRSIVARPEAIDEIPELFGETGMKEFIRQINAPGGVFETIRMLHWVTPGNATFQRSLCLGFIFRDRALFGQYSNCLMVVGNLLQMACAGTDFCDGPPLMEIEQAYLWEERRHGWIMDIYVGGIAETESTAGQRLDEHLQRLTPFLRTGVFPPLQVPTSALVAN